MNLFVRLFNVNGRDWLLSEVELIESIDLLFVDQTQFIIHWSDGPSASRMHRTKIVQNND